MVEEYFEIYTSKIAEIGLKSSAIVGENVEIWNSKIA